MYVDIDNVMRSKFLYKFRVDVDMNCFMTNYNKNGLTVDEFVAWFMHELFANVITDDTLLHYKKLIINNYDLKLNGMTGAINTYGDILWYGIFANTDKKFSNINSSVNSLLECYDLASLWDEALKKYVSMTGGDVYILSDDHLNYIHTGQIRVFNTIVRKYGTIGVKYNNMDWSIYSNYISSLTHSKLLKSIISEEPRLEPIFDSKNIFSIFKDEDAFLENTTILEAYDDCSPDTIYFKAQELVNDANGIETQSDKLLIQSRIHDLALFTDKRLRNDSLNIVLQKVKDILINLKNKVDSIEPDITVSINEFN
jgi:hypothetical protein